MPAVDVVDGGNEAFSSSSIRFESCFTQLDAFKCQKLVGVGRGIHIRITLID